MENGCPGFLDNGCPGFLQDFPGLLDNGCPGFLPALFVLELPGRAFPFEEFADSFGQLGEAEVGKITNRLPDEFKLGSAKITAREGNLRWQHDGSPLLLSLPYLKAEGMSREKCNQAKKFHEPGAEAVWDDSDCRDQSEKFCRQSAGQANSGRADWAAKWRICGVPTLEKPTTAWVERQFEAAGSPIMQDTWSS
jgi:hypothetical protein